jgi:hypothetical protein
MTQFVCEECPSVFENIRELRNHVRKHKSQIDLKYKEDNSKTIWRISLKILFHLAVVCVERIGDRFLCFCGKSFAAARYLKAHHDLKQCRPDQQKGNFHVVWNELIIDEVKFKGGHICIYCSKCFTRRSDVERHIKNIHKGKESSEDSLQVSMKPSLSWLDGNNNLGQKRDSLKESFLDVIIEEPDTVSIFYEKMQRN